MTVTSNGEVLEVEGDLPAIGLQAPDFCVKDLNGHQLCKSDLHGKVVIISVVPDIETSVCSIQSNKFNEYAKQADNIEIISISNNPTAVLQKWQAETGANLPMYNEATQFAKDYGVYLPASGNTARSVFVLNANGEIAYQELVAENSDQPDYERALAAAQSVAKV